MGGNCCSDNNVTKSQFPSGGQAAVPRLESKTLYMSTVEEILNMSKNGLGSSYIPLTGSSNPLLMPIGAEMDPKSYVRFFLIFTFYINKYAPQKPPVNRELREEYEANFYKLVSKTHPGEEEQKKLQEFRKQFEKETSELKKWMVVVNHMFHDKFIIENLNQILLKSKDPKDIAHIAFPIAAIFRGISNAYLSVKSKKPAPIFIVAVLDDDEMSLIKSMKDKNCGFAFPIFMRGFTDDQRARKQLKKVKEQYKNQKTAVLFTVNFPSQDKLDPLNDYGYYINPDTSTKEEGDVVFNILNTFKVVTIFSKTEIDLEYGHLSAIYHTNKAERIKGQDAGAIRVYDICEAVSQHYLKSQSCLFRIINEQKESLHFSRSVISHSRAPTQASSNSPPATQIQLENMVNNYIDNKQWNQALQLIASNQSNLMRAKKLEIFYKQGKIKEAKELIPKIVPEYKPINQATEIRDFIQAKLTIKDGSAQSKKEAITKLRLLADRMAAKYKSSFEVIGTEVITAIEQLVGGAGKDKDEKSLFESQAETKAALQTTAINLRGISTTI